MSDSGQLDLVGHTDIARLAGVGPSAVSNWVHRYEDWPSSVTRGSRRLYPRSEALAFLRQHPELCRLPLPAS